MEALFVAADNTASEFNTSIYRVLTPVKYLRLAGHNITVLNQPATGRTDLNTPALDTNINYAMIPDVVVWERTITTERVEKLRAAGAKRIIVTFDDNYRLITNALSGVMESSKGYWSRSMLSDWMQALGMVDLVIVPSMVLLNDFKGIASNIKYVPNYLDPEIWSGHVKDKYKRVLGWGGSTGHLDCWCKSKVAAGVRLFLDRHPDFSAEFYGLVGQLKDHPRVSARKWVRIDEWPEVVSEFGVGLAPLWGEYDNRRSNLKLLEFGACGVPVVGTAWGEYPRWREKVGGVLIRPNAGAREWADAMDYVLQNRGTYTARGAELAGEFMADKPQNIQVYEEILWNSKTV